MTLILLIFVLLLLAGGGGYYGYSTWGPSGGIGVVGLVLIIAAAFGYIEWTRLSARESADDAQIDGHISPISPRVGGTVIAG